MGPQTRLRHWGSMLSLGRSGTCAVGLCYLGGTVGVTRATEAKCPRILVRGSWLPWEHAGPPPGTCETPKLLLPPSSSWVKFPASCLSVSSGSAKPPTWVATAASPIDVPWPQECTLFCAKLCAPTVLTLLCDALQLAGIPLRLGSRSPEWSRCLGSGAEP